MPAQEDQSMLEQMAERLKLEGDDLSDFINSGMKRMGYVAKTIFTDPEPDKSANGGGDFFSRRQQQSNGGETRRQVSGAPRGGYEG
jgi:hypothetical protein